jgi:hypothetical protein
MGIVSREAPHEPDERPTELGRHIWTECVVEHPGEWRVVFEDTNRQKVVMMEGCLLGRGQGRIAPIIDLTGWDARCVGVPSSNGDAIGYELRVKFTPSKHTKADEKFDSTIDKLRQGHHIEEPETARLAGTGGA